MLKELSVSEEVHILQYVPGQASGLGSEVSPGVWRPGVTHSWLEMVTPMLSEAVRVTQDCSLLLPEGGVTSLEEDPGVRTVPWGWFSFRLFRRVPGECSCLV